jgi:hypothetical protein
MAMPPTGGVCEIPQQSHSRLILNGSVGTKKTYPFIPRQSHSLHRLRQRLHQHRLLLRLSQPRPQLCLCVHNSGKTRVCLHPQHVPGSGKTTSSSMAITASTPASTPLFDDCLDMTLSLSTRTMRLRLHVRLPQYQDPIATLTMATPRTATSTKFLASNDLGYLNIGTKGYHLA